MQSTVVFVQATSKDNFALVCRHVPTFVRAECDQMRIGFNLDVREISAVKTNNGHDLFPPAEAAGATETKRKWILKTVESKPLLN